MDSKIVLVILFTTVTSFVIQSDRVNAVFTTFTVYYPDSNLDFQKIYLRGDNCNLTWNLGLLLNHTAANQWQAAFLCP